MKRILLLAAFACVFALQATAQEKGVQTAIWYQSSSNTFLSSKYDFSSVDLVVSLGYSFNGRLAVRVPFTFATQLYRIQPVQTYEKNVMIGGTVSYDLFVGPEMRIEVAGTVGGTVTCNKPVYVYYDGGVFANIGNRSKFSAGLGVRHYQSSTSGAKNYTTMYVGIGCRFN